MTRSSSRAAVERARDRYAGEAQRALAAARSHDRPDPILPNWTLVTCRECAAGSRRIDAASLTLDLAVAQHHAANGARTPQRG